MLASVSVLLGTVQKSCDPLRGEGGHQKITNNHRGGGGVPEKITYDDKGGGHDRL